jgi:hypothetical protein
LDNLADQLDKVLQELARLASTDYLLPDIEKRLALLRGKTPAARPRIVGRNPMKSPVWKIIVPSLGIAAHEAPWILPIILCTAAGRDEPLHTSG